MVEKDKLKNRIEKEKENNNKRRMKGEKEDKRSTRKVQEVL